MSKSVSASGKIGAAKKIPLALGAWLRFARALEQVARVSHVGCIKYAAPEGSLDYLEIDNAQNVFLDAQARHTKGERLEGPINVEKGGALPPEGMAVLHAAQNAWNALARLEHQLREYENAGFHINEVLDNAPGYGDNPNDVFRKLNPSREKGSRDTGRDAPWRDDIDDENDRGC